MTALQAWLNFRPMGPRSLKTLVCSVLGERPDAEPPRPAGPARRSEAVLIQPGIERC